MFAIGAFATAFRPPSEHKLYFFVTGVLLVLFIGLRNQVGADWWNYLSIFKHISHGSLRYGLTIAEPSYVLTNWIAAKEHWGIWFPNVVCAILFTIGLIALCRQQPNPWLALAVSSYTVILVGMGYTRQSAALGMGMLAIVQYTRGATLRMAICIAIAVSFHTSAIIFAPIFALAVARRSVGTTFLIGCLGLVLLYDFYEGVLLLVSRYTEQTFTATGAVPRLLLNMIPALLFLALRRRFARNAPELRLWTIFALLACMSLVLLFFLKSSLIADRLGLYMSPIQIFVLSRVPLAFSNGQRPSLALLCAVLAYSLVVEIVWLTYGTWGPYWLPYRNFLWETVTTRTPPRWFYYIR